MNVFVNCILSIDINQFYDFYVLIRPNRLIKLIKRTDLSALRGAFTVCNLSNIPVVGRGRPGLLPVN